MYSHDLRALFIHVQKTGGSTIDRLLLEHLPGAVRVATDDRRHMTLEEALAEFPDLTDYWTFGFVRNPWARLHSWHSMILRRGIAADNGQKRALRQLRNNSFWSGVLKRYPTFEGFVLEGPEEFERLRRPQLGYLRTDGKRADFIGRTESFDHDVAQVLERLGLPVPTQVPRYNAAPAIATYRDHYSPAMRDRVSEIFAPDIEEFGYEF